jgi:formylglycine-generating enzyme required for sulfatase activity
MIPEDDNQSLGEGATDVRVKGRPSRYDLSLGDEWTTGGEAAEAVDTILDEIEVVDLATRYKIERTLGQGGMGTVLLATDTRLGRKVAIKRILGEAGRSKTAMMRFLTEAKAIAAISHPNVVQIYELGVAEDGPFLVIEYIDGGSLLDLCKAGPIAAEKAIGLIAQVCDGLGRAHDVGIIHRDIKPANVLVTRDGIAKLTDFGLAKAEIADHQMTMTGAVMGTPDFMPPEQRQDAAEVDHRSDLWSLGATLYQAITGRSPKVIRLHELPEDLQPIVAKALEDAKDARYQSAREFRDDLKATIRTVTPEGPVAALREGQCPACHAQNDPKRKFCRGCGGSLEGACLACDEGVPMWDEICGSCGAKQAPLIDARVAEMTAAQTQAEEFLRGCEFAKAETALNALRAEMHPRLAQLRPWVEQFATRIETSRQENLTRAAEAVQQALAHEQAFDYAAGIRALEPIPAAVRRLALSEANGTAGDVYDRLQHRAAAAVSLEKTIRDAVAARNLVGLLPQVVALAELRPDRADVAKLREQLEARARAIAERREATLVRAHEAHARQDYEAAVKLLEQIGLEGTNDEVERFASENRLLEAQSLSLRQQITEATAAGRLDGLVELIDEYCVIKPTTPELVSLRAKAAEHAEQARRVAKRKRVMRVAAGVVLGILAIGGIAAKLWRDAVLQRAAQVRLAIEGARWDEALAIEPENVSALVGRARQKLSAEPQDVAGAFLDLDRAERNRGDAAAVRAAWADAFAVRAREQAKINRLEEAEQDLAEARRLGGSAELVAAAQEALMAGWVARAQAASELLLEAAGLVTTDDIRSAAAKAIEAMLLDTTGSVTALKQPANDALRAAVVAEYQSRFDESVSGGDWDVGLRIAAAAGALDDTASGWVGDAIAKHPGGLSAVPPEVLGRLPATVIGGLPTALITALPAGTLAALPPLGNSIGMELRLLAPGRFTMGQAGSETPHEVTLTKPFYIGVYEVTNAQWQRVMGSVPSRWKEQDRPVERVSWDDAVEFCRRLSALPDEHKAGRVYRLPTEAEWEYACRAGSTTRYCFGDDESRLGDYGWFDGNSGDQTHPVGRKKANAWGLFDMHGNVWEWCSDRYADYGRGDVTDPQGPSGASVRVFRGGSWLYPAWSCRSAYRDGHAPSRRLFDLGFRLALSPSGAKPVPPEAATGK